MEKLGGEGGAGGKADAAQTTKRGKRRLEAITFSMIYTAITLTHLDKWIVYLLVLLDGFQLFHFSWKENYMLDSAAGGFFSSIGAFTTEYATFEVMFYVSFIVVLFNAAMLLTVGGLMHRGQFRNVWSLDVIRVLSILLNTILLVPIINIFVSGLHCNYGTMNLVIFPSEMCFGNRNLFPYIGSIIGLCIMIPFSVMSPITMLDSRPSPNAFAGTQAQGKTDSLYSALRLALVFVHVIVDDTDFTCIALICNFVAFGFLFYAYSLVLPFYSFLLNRIRCAFLMAAVLSSISAIITFAVQGDETSALIAQIASSAVGLLLGFACPALTRRRLTKGIYARITEEIALKAPRKSPNKEPPPTKKHALREKPVGVDEAGSNSYLLQLVDIESIANTRTVERPPIFRRETDVEVACRFVRHNNTAEAKGLMHFIFRSGLQQYPKSVYLYAMYAFYIHEFDFVKDKQAKELLEYCSRQLHAKFPDRLLLFFIQHSLETSLNPQGDNNELSISSHAEYQSLEASARHFHTQTLEELRGFWAYMSSANAISRDLPVFAQKIMHAERKGDAYYKKLVQRFPKSKVMMRMYATWLQQVKHDTDLAKEFFELADQIENTEANEALKESQEFSPDDNTDYPEEEEDEGKVDGDDASIVEDEGRKNLPFDPDQYLMKKASRSQSNFRLHTGSFLEFQAQPVPDSGDQLGSIKQTADFTEEKDNTLPTEEGKTEAPQENYQVRQTAFLTAEDPLSSRRASKNLSILNTESEQQDVQFQESKQDYAKGPRSESNASSSASTKAMRMKRVQRSQLQIRLTNEINAYGIKIAVLSVISMGMVVGTYIVAVNQFSNFNDQLANMAISTRLGNRFLLLAMSIREQAIFARANNTVQFAASRKDCLSEVERLRTSAIPYLSAYYENPYWIPVLFSQYPNGTGTYMRLNEYGVGTGAFQFSIQLNISMSRFADPAIGKNNYFRFFAAPNAITMGSALDGLSLGNQRRFIEMSNDSMTTLYALIGVVTFTVVAAGFGLFNPMVKRSGSTQTKVMKLFTVLSKKACRHIHTNIEEDLENFIATGDDQEIQIANEAKMRVSPTVGGDLASQNSSRRMLRIIVFWLAATLVSTLAIFAPPIGFELDGITMVKAINWSDARRYQAMLVLRLALELAAQDDETYREYPDVNRVLAKYNDAINILQAQHKLVTTGHGDNGAQLDIPPLSDMTYIKDITTIPGTCLAGPNLCDPSVHYYNSTIGYTYAVETAGLDNYIETYIETSKRFAETDPENMSLDNPDYQYLKIALTDLRLGLSMVVDRLMAYQIDKSAEYTKMLNALFPIAILVILCSHVAFRRIVRDRTAEMHQIIQLLFSIPNTIMEECPQILQYIQSGGVLGLEEKD